MVISYLLTPLFFLFFGLTLAVFHPIQVITRNLFGAKAHDKTVGTLNFCLTKCLLILGTKIKFNGFRELPLDEPILVISNHQSMWDISPVIWKLQKKRTKYIAKASLAKNIPSISYNLKYGGSLSIDRNDPAGSIEKIEEFAGFIAENNFAICIYPEGTRSRDGKVKPFKLSGIDAILKVIPDIKVVPIAIKNTGEIDNGGKFAKNLGVKASFTMLADRKINRGNLETDLEAIRQEIMAVIRV
ncbi:MAG: lysophospholipid acyltransferase family protein [Crocinitomix sp.]|nr:lysophospholipid acyltransferase family protein [Crocinitomix sp.]